MTGFVRSQYVNVGATASAAILAFGLVTVPAEGHDSVNVRIEFAAVQLQSAVADQISAVVNYAPYAGAETPELQVTKAAATAGDALSISLSTVGRNLLLFVGTVLLPIWWVGFPITYPLYKLVWDIQNPGIYNPPPFDFLGWGIAPYSVLDNLANLLFPQAAPTPTVAAQRSASSAVPESNVEESAGGTVQPPVTQPVTSAASADKGGPPIGRQRGSVQRGRTGAAVAASAIATATPTVATPAADSTTSALDELVTPAAPGLISDAPSTGRSLRTTRANKNTANTDATVVGASDVPPASVARQRRQ